MHCVHGNKYALLQRPHSEIEVKEDANRSFIGNSNRNSERVVTLIS